MTIQGHKSDVLPPPGTRITMDVLDRIRLDGIQHLGYHMYWWLKSNKPQESYAVVQRMLDTLHPDVITRLDRLNEQSFTSAYRSCRDEKHFRALNNLLPFIDIFESRTLPGTKQDGSGPDNLYTLLLGFDYPRLPAAGGTAPMVLRDLGVDYFLLPEEELLNRRAVLTVIVNTRYPDPMLVNPVWISAECEQYILQHRDSVDRMISIINSHQLKIELPQHFDTLTELMADTPVPPRFTEGQL